MKYQNYTNLIILLIFLFFLITGIVIFDDYGISWDEHFQRIDGFIALNSIRELLSLETYEGFNHSDQRFADAAKIYGVLYNLPLAVIEKAFSIDDSKNYFLIRHLANFLIFYISTIFFYLLLKKRFSTKLSIIGLIFLILSPRIFADSFYNNKDLIFLSLFIISIYFTVNFINQITYANSFFAALTCAFATDVRIIGIIAPLIILFFFFLEAAGNKRFFIKYYIKIVSFLTLYISFVFIFWPYLWNDPLVNFFNTLKIMSSYSWSGGIFYLGEYVNALNLPWHYPIVWILISTPILYIILFIIGSILIFSKISSNFINLTNSSSSKDIWNNNNEKTDLIFIIIFYFTLFLIIKLNSTLYGGWRHLYFIYPCLIYISVKGLEFIINKISFKYTLIFTIPFLIFTFLWMVQNHPYQFIYFNKLAGKNVENKFELDYWGTSNKDVLDYILNNSEESIIKIYILSSSPYEYSLSLIDKNKRGRIAFVDNQKDADFLVTNHYYQKGNPVNVNNKLKKEFKIFKEFKVDGMPINTIFKNN